LTHEEILDYLLKIEKAILPDMEYVLESKKEEVFSKLYPYRESYLEFVITLGEDPEKYQTQLAELYITNLFLIQDKFYHDGILLPNLVNPKRQKLIKFLEEKDKYKPGVLLDLIEKSWMFEEKIILLVKTNSYDEAITIFVEK
jgi:hypothetical protein